MRKLLWIWIQKISTLLSILCAETMKHIDDVIVGIVFLIADSYCRKKKAIVDKR